MAIETLRLKGELLRSFASATQRATLRNMNIRRGSLILLCLVFSCKGGGGGGGRNGDGGNGGSSGNVGNVSAALERSCKELATSQCEKQQSCNPRGFPRAFADLDACVARAQLTCPIIASAPGSGYTPSSVSDCANALASATCADIANNLGPAACHIRGTLGLGAACIDDAQCAGTENFCRLSGACGVCAARKPQSDLSAYSDCGSSAGCQDGLVCALGRCLPTVALTDACDLSHPCPAPYACDTGKCIAATLAVGAACDIYGDACDVSQGLVCVDNVCKVWPTAHLGETCGLQGNLVTFCLAGAVCDVVKGNYLGTCRPPTADGEECDDRDYIYDTCQPPATCTGGFCNLPEPLACVSPDAGRG